ncbi:acyl-CoA dehydrogenase family protein [Sporichthya sp.]|uniref:acyl-CoA dehydrogenase family protein n=1 Tax=Sporichthya sp. TaxID=65475 RepID=UPI0017B4F644|nr:acyl-CoA dehydrogenase family protein [Sporichthya sp.]MBA3741459.1 acyl-CoA/acyl-ACP dehydrogenase [Sporichthya sp.]
MDFSFTPEQEELRARATDAGMEWRDEAAVWDAENDAPYEKLNERFRDLGLLGLTMPKEYGGKGGTVIDYVIVTSALFRASQSWVCGEPPFCTSGPGPSIVLMAEREETRQKFLPDIVTGKKGCALALSEPAHGSDLTHLETTAVRDGDSYVLNGSKRFITGAIFNDLYAVFARMTDEPGARGIGAIIVEKDTPGFTMNRGPEFVASRGIPHGELYFDNCRVPAENLVVGAGKFADLMTAFNMERMHNSAYSLGFAEAAYDEAAKYAQQRVSFGREIIEFQSSYHMLADMWVQIEAHRLLTYKAAATARDGRFPEGMESTISKLYGATMLPQLTLNAIQLHGGDGVTMDYPVQRIHRESLISLAAGGAPPLLRNTIASRLFPHRRFSQTRS